MAESYHPAYQSPFAESNLQCGEEESLQNSNVKDGYALGESCYHIGGDYL